ncbi:MAG: hypothetical protein KF686_04745 [Ramlibacter sp.]|nr:hypothetical protein [Ramlibacter sp.]
MTPLNDLSNALRASAGIRAVADLGVVDEGRVGHAACTVSVGLEQWQGLYFVAVSVRHQKNRAGGQTRVVKWPYSRVAAADLAGVITDLQTLEAAAASGFPVGPRSWLGRALDRLTGAESLGEYRFVSVVQGEGESACEIVARLTRWRSGLEVSLANRRPGVETLFAQFPHKACVGLRQALERYAG